MSFLDKLLGKKKEYKDWNATTRGVLHDISYNEIESSLGRPVRAQGGFVFWRGPLNGLDPDYPSDEYFQISNKDFRFGTAAKKPPTDTEKWFIYATSDKTIRIVANELGALARDIEAV